MTPEQKAKLIALYTPFLDNNYPVKRTNKRRKEIERAVMVGAYAYANATAPNPDDNVEPHLGLLLMSGRLLSEEPTS